MKKSHTWYVRMMVPAQYRKQLGRTRYVVSLKTRDLAEASRRKHAVLADLQRQMDAALAGQSGAPQSASSMLERAEWERQRIDSGEASEGEATASFEAAFDDFIEAEARRKGRDPETGHPVMSEVDVRVIRAAHATVAGTGGLLLDRAADMYLEEIASTIRNQTLREKRRGLHKLSTWLGPAHTVKAITRQVAGRYVTLVVAKSGRAPKTQRDEVGHLSSFFNWLERRGAVDTNPFHRVSGSIRSSTLGKKSKRRPWENEEVLGLLQGVPVSDPLWPMVAIATYTGMRREEVCSLRAADVKGTSWTVNAGKTESAVRTIPIHPVLMPLVNQLIAKTDDGFLIPGLLTGGDDDKRGHLVGKRFGTMCERLGFDDSGLNYHTLRNSFIQRCEEAGIPASTAKQLSGHKRGDITFGLYSPGVTQGSLLKALEGVTFGALDDYVRSVGATVEVTVRSRRRTPRKVA